MRFPATSRGRARALTLVLVVAWVSAAAAQSPPGMGRGQPPTGPSPQAVMPGQAAAVPVVPDTVTIAFSVPDSLPAPAALHVVQDTLLFGGFFHVVCDYPSSVVADGLPPPLTDGTWLEPVGSPVEAALDLSGLPPTTGHRVVRTYRVYRRDPLRIAWGDHVSDVIFIRGQTAGADQTASIRDPRRLRWTPWTLLGLAALLLLLGLLAWTLWRRRRAPPPLADWAVPPPAWLAAATGLHDLLHGPELARGDTRAWLDRLAGLARDYVAGRYRIGAREMTGREIAAACAVRGFAPGHPAGFGRLIDLADRERYNPEAPDTAFCREQAVQFFGRLARVRVEGRHVPVPASVRTAAEAAWRDLARDLGTGAGREVPAPSLAGEER